MVLLIATAAPAAEGLTVTTLIEQGGYVMIPLLALSIIAAGLVVERAWFWLSTNRGASPAWLSRLSRALRRGNRTEAVRTIESRPSTLYAEIAAALLKHGATDAVALEAVEAARPRMERFMVMLSTIITAAPLLGILGTVIGIIQSFQILGATTSTEMLTDPADIATGIAQALLTTAVGLIVAIATLFPYMAFRKQVDRGIGRLEALIAAAQEGASKRPTAAEPQPDAADSQQDSVKPARKPVAASS